MLRLVRLSHSGSAPILALSRTGNAAVYLGRGFFLTAAHVVGSPKAPAYIVSEDRSSLAALVHLGSLEGIDLGLLKLESGTLPDRLVNLPAVPLCRGEPPPGRKVLVAEFDNVAPSYIVGPDVLPPDVPRRFDSLIRDVYTTGNSGSGVFDAGEGCLWGIVSRKIEQTVHGQDGSQRRQGIAKYFVPAREIRQFLAEAGVVF